MSDVDDTTSGAGTDQLVHVEDVDRVEHGAARGKRDHGDRTGQALGDEPRAVQRVDRDIARRAPAAESLAVRKHGGVILFALTDDHRSVERCRGELGPHSCHGSAIRRVLVVHSKPGAGCFGRRLRGANQRADQPGVVAVGAKHCGRRTHPVTLPPASRPGSM
jgi:hypothetical protein